MSEKEYIITPRVRVRFATLHENVVIEGDDTGKRSITILGDKNDKAIKAIINQMEKMVVDYYANKKQKIPADFRRSYGDGDRKVEAWGDSLTGMIYIKANQKEEYGIAIIDHKKQKIPADQIETAIYPGCLVKIKFAPRIYDKKSFTPGITCDVVAIQKVGDGLVLANSGAIGGFDDEDYVDETEQDPFDNVTETETLPF